MKQIITPLATKIFLTGLLFILLISSCKKDKFKHHDNLPTPITGTLTATPTNSVTPTPTITITPTPTTTVTITNTLTPTPNSTYCLSGSYTIWTGAGKNDTTKGIKVGTVSYYNDSVNLYIKYSFAGPTCPKEIHLWVGSEPSKMPHDNKGVPFGQFPYTINAPACGSYSVTIPLADLFNPGPGHGPGHGPDLKKDFCDKHLYVAFHAEMNDGQTAIGYGSQTFGGPGWGWMAHHPICCHKK